MPRAKFWKYDSTEDAYNDSQVNPMVRDGAVLTVPSEGVYGVLVEAWPTAVTGLHGEFHTLAPGVTWESLDDGKYADAAARAAQLAMDALHRAQRGEA